ncbi:MAG: Flp family type IVb pilin [Sphingomonadales bacterium]|nr:Flp family type IVb pilin [Sphingomonadales bacterium]MDE2169584.1 Flp family type IVb pilin [Sphingomonadales bacterium]
MTNFIGKFLRNESGAAAAEYALILAVVGAGIAASALLLGQKVNSAVTGAANLICSGGSSVCSAAS